ncbi:uncharacterized protein RSE6_14612 [Rhynchosporium secalis]|uniref:Kynurenine formamidase n=1 Tax=Rhynchosporium secalis TaxID=38038 RepID=A0A1E1MWB1_RHYSE|nr:uncharacterized protein RSE6_14612 [Rhynchosporium secalis]
MSSVANSGLRLPVKVPEQFSQALEIKQEDFSYGDHDLQKVSVYRRRWGEESARLPAGKGVWIIYIHGGAWRDPAVTDTSIRPAIRELFKNPSSTKLIDDNVRYIASISYRLSYHSLHPQKPETPDNQINRAKHPDHIQDVITGISFLQDKYGFGSKYILVGHSCGATLAFQIFLRKIFSIPHDIPFKNPEVVVGVAGIYDMRLLRDKNPHPIYQDFLVSAFGHEVSDWDSASPANYNLSTFKWPEVKAILVVSSSGDELVDASQINCMDSRLENMTANLRVKVLKGFVDQTHNDIWEKGIGLAKIIVESLETWLDITKAELEMLR